MSRAYTPALTVDENVKVEKVRELPLPGKSLVELGDRVEADTVVLEAELPGDLTILHMAERIGFDAKEVCKHSSFSKGQRIEKGELLCEIPSLFGLLKSQLHSPTSGSVEFFTELNAHLGLRHESSRLAVSAYIGGEVTAVEDGKSVTISTSASLIQGIFGVGGECFGTILALDAPADLKVDAGALRKHSELKGKVIIGGSSFSKNAIEYAANNGAVGIVTGSIDAATLADYVGREIGVSITGDEDVPTTLLVTEGFGELAMAERVRVLAKKLDGKPASLNGATQVRAGATRPEVIVTNNSGDSEKSSALAKPLEVGAAVRIIRVPYFGKLAEVVELPQDAELIPSGAKVRVLRARLENGEIVSVPRANVELV